MGVFFSPDLENKYGLRASNILKYMQNATKLTRIEKITTILQYTHFGKI
jgi:hypothetical protein